MDPSHKGTIKISDARGRIVKQFSMNGNNRTTIHIEQAGIYLVQLTAGGKTQTKKILITH